MNKVLLIILVSWVASNHNAYPNSDDPNSDDQESVSIDVRTDKIQAPQVLVWAYHKMLREFPFCSTQSWFQPKENKWQCRPISDYEVRCRRTFICSKATQKVIEEEKRNLELLTKNYEYPNINFQIYYRSSGEVMEWNSNFPFTYPLIKDTNLPYLKDSNKSVNSLLKGQPKNPQDSSVSKVIVKDQYSLIDYFNFELSTMILMFDSQTSQFQGRFGWSPAYDYNDRWQLTYGASFHLMQSKSGENFGVISHGLGGKYGWGSGAYLQGGAGFESWGDEGHQFPFHYFLSYGYEVDSKEYLFHSINVKYQRVFALENVVQFMVGVQFRM